MLWPAALNPKAMALPSHIENTMHHMKASTCIIWNRCILGIRMSGLTSGSITRRHAADKLRIIDFNPVARA
jgi:hypothetical protein